MQNFENCMINLVNKFSNINFFHKNPNSTKFKSIKDHKTSYIYKNKKYNIKTIDYIYIFQQALLNISKDFKYISIGDSIYFDIFNNMLNKKIKPNVDNGRVISIKKEGDNIMFEEDAKVINNFLVLNDKKDFFSKGFILFAENILHNLLNTYKNFYYLICHSHYTIGSHCELILFQIYDNKLYIVNYDPSILKNLGEEMNIFLKLLENCFKLILENVQITMDIVIVNKAELIFDYNNKKYGGLQKLSDNLKYVNEGPSTGICEIFSIFILYFVVYIQYSSKNTYLCSELIKNIEHYFFSNFIVNNRIEYFSDIIINFANHVTDNYYSDIFFQISKDEKNSFELELQYLLDYLFGTFKNLIPYNETIEPEFLKSSGYYCNTNNECSSNNCVNNICYTEEKAVDPEDIRSVGNPCLYDIQCRSGHCKDNTCIGEDNYEKAINPEYYEDVENQILDRENSNIYL